GKTLLVDMTSRACAEMGLSVQRSGPNRIPQMTPGELCDVLLVDEADMAPDSMRKALSSEAGKNIAKTTVLFGRGSYIHHTDISTVHPVVIELTPLSLADARLYLLQRATDSGWSDLFTPDALDLIAKGSHGSLQLLRSIACFAYLRAANDGTPQIS